MENSRLFIWVDNARFARAYGIQSDVAVTVSSSTNGDQDATIVEASGFIATIEFHESVLVDGMRKMKHSNI